jgi:hypothetical protein
VSRVINFDKGSKRRLGQVRWKRHEIVSAILLFLILTVLCLWLALREASHYHYSDPPRTPQVTAALDDGQRKTPHWATKR